MTVKQKILKAVYPVFMWISKKKSGAGSAIANKTGISPIEPFYGLSGTLINGAPFDFSQLRGKKVLIVNTASDCGYTGQYDDLEKLQQRYRDDLVIVGFPSNDFGEQEKGEDDVIAKFCKVNYGVTFLLMKKSVVIQSPEQNKIYQWLTDSAKNGWNTKAPSWNFSKYLVDVNGKLSYYFEPAVDPLGKEMEAGLV